MKVLEEIIQAINPTKAQSEIEQSSRVIWASVHGITLLSLDDLLFSSTPIDGHLLIDNLLLNYINQWKQH